MWTTHMQAVILAAGRGSRMTELLGNQIPKCLIPIGGNPLIFYPLKALAELGFRGKGLKKFDISCNKCTQSKSRRDQSNVQCVTYYVQQMFL